MLYHKVENNLKLSETFVENTEAESIGLPFSRPIARVGLRYDLSIVPSEKLLKFYSQRNYLPFPSETNREQSLLSAQLSPQNE